MDGGEIEGSRRGCELNNRTMDKTNVSNAIVGITGWTLANVPHMIESISGIITVITSIMGVVMLAVSIRTGILNYRMKKMDLEERRRKSEKENTN